MRANSEARRIWISGSPVDVSKRPDARFSWTPNAIELSLSTASSGSPCSTPSCCSATPTPGASEPDASLHPSPRRIIHPTSNRRARRHGRCHISVLTASKVDGRTGGNPYSVSAGSSTDVTSRRRERRSPQRDTWAQRGRSSHAADATMVCVGADWKATCTSTSFSFMRNRPRHRGARGPRGRSRAATGAFRLARRANRVHSCPRSPSLGPRER